MNKNMKQLKHLIISIIAVGLLIACSSKENHNDLLKKIMVKRLESIKGLNGIPYIDTTLENGDFFFGIETEAEHYSLRGNYQSKDDYLVFSLYENYWEGVAEGYITGIYKNEGSGWTSVFQEPLVDGSLDTIIDLNNDKVNEIVMNVRTSGSHGTDPCNKLILYGRKNSNVLEEVDVIAERIISGSKRVKDYTISYEPISEGVVIVVKSEEGKDLDSNDPQKTTTHRFEWQPPLLTDLNKPDYAQVKIGEQTWMSSNLDVKTFRNGDSIPQAKTENEWYLAVHNQKPAWCRYDTGYSKWYNWYAVNDPRGLAPSGWHIPSDKEWSQLIDFLGGGRSAVTKIKSKDGWSEGGGTNESGFSANPDGVFDGSWEFSCGIGVDAHWWSSTEDSTKIGWCWSITNDSTITHSDKNNKNTGMSVRCIRN
jgi:uncharacterized protein (TIGR02145 family)